MCFDADSEPPIPRIAGAAVSHDDLTLASADGTELAAFLATPDRRGEQRRRDPARRPRPLPLLRGARAPLRRAWLPRDRDRLLRPHRGRGEARRGLRVHAARRPDDRRQRAGRHACRRREAARARRHVGVHRRLLLRRPCLVGRGGVRSRPRRRDRLLRRADPRARRRKPGRTRRPDRVPDPRPAGGCRPEHHRRGQRRVRHGADRSGHRA